MIGAPGCTYWPSVGTLLAMPSNGARTTVCSRSSAAASRDRLRGQIRGLLGDGPIEVAAQARADLVERALGDLNFLVRDVALVACLVDVDLRRELALRERGEPVEFALLVRRVRARERELLRAPGGTRRACSRRSR